MADIPKGELADLDDLKDWLPREEPGDDVVLQPLLDTVEELLERKTGKNFTIGGAVTDEPHDGSGTNELRLDRPPVTVDAAIKVGEVVASPDSTIPVVDIIVVQEEFRLTYEGGRTFKKGRRNIFVTYTAAEYLPTIAKRGVCELSAMIYRRRGAEHLRGQSIGELGSVALIASRLEFLPMWREAVRELRLDWFG